MQLFRLSILLSFLAINAVEAFTTPTTPHHSTITTSICSKTSSLWNSLNADDNDDSSPSTSVNRRDAIETSGKMLASLLLSSAMIDGMGIGGDQYNMAYAVEELSTPKTILITGT